MAKLLILAAVIICAALVSIPIAIRNILEGYRRRKQEHRNMIRAMIDKKVAEMKEQGWDVTVTHDE